MVEQISAYGLQLQSARLLKGGSGILATLQQQLATGVKSSDLTDYSFSDTKKMLDFRNSVTRREAYVDAIDSVRPRLVSYQTTLERLSEINSDMQSLVYNAQTYEQAQSISLEGQLESYATEIRLLLNQRVGDRYIYGGERYSAYAVAGDILSLALPPAETYPVTTPALPPWDPERIAGTGTNARVWTQVSTTIEDGQSLTYGIRSIEDGIQELVQGLRWAYAAVNDQANYGTYIASARTEFDAASPDLRTLEATVAQNIKTIDETRNLHVKLISDLQDNIQDIQNVDVNEVATKITFYQSQLQASYSVTAQLAQLTILNYFR